MATFFTFEQREGVGERSGHSHISLPLIASREHGEGKGACMYDVRKIFRFLAPIPPCKDQLKSPI